MDDADLDATIEQMHSALNEFVTGDPEPLKSMYSRRDDVTLANPFGPAVSGWQRAAETMERAAANYRDGRATGFETIAKNVTNDLSYTVEVERYVIKVAGSEELVEVALRVTSIFRPEEGVWKIVHRHADPITAARPVDSVLQR
jgi:ketosteroid isomerase-like protein